jgi:hypothetical protein
MKLYRGYLITGESTERVGGTYGGSRKRPARMLPAVVRQLAELCQSGEELIQSLQKGTLQWQMNIYE